MQRELLFQYLEVHKCSTLYKITVYVCPYQSHSPYLYGLYPHFSYPSVASQCIEKKREITRKLEEKIETGLERYLYT